MLSEHVNKIPLSVVKKTAAKTNDVKIIQMQSSALHTESNKSDEKLHLSPPPSQFNMGYFKGRDNDIL